MTHGSIAFLMFFFCLFVLWLGVSCQWTSESIRSSEVFCFSFCSSLPFLFVVVVYQASLFALTFVIVSMQSVFKDWMCLHKCQQCSSTVFRGSSMENVSKPSVWVESHLINPPFLTTDYYSCIIFGWGIKEVPSIQWFCCRSKARSLSHREKYHDFHKAMN